MECVQIFGNFHWCYTRIHREIVVIYLFSIHTGLHSCSRGILKQELCLPILSWRYSHVKWLFDDFWRNGVMHAQSNIWCYTRRIYRKMALRTQWDDCWSCELTVLYSLILKRNSCVYSYSWRKCKVFIARGSHDMRLLSVIGKYTGHRCQKNPFFILR